MVSREVRRRIKREGLNNKNNSYLSRNNSKEPSLFFFSPVAPLNQTDTPFIPTDTLKRCEFAGGSIPPATRAADQLFQALPRAADLGKHFFAVVIQEIQNQKRSGGLLQGI